MKAIILAAGKGSRLLPMTLLKPKPLLKINGKTILENIIKRLKNAGVKDITVVTGYKNEMFNPYKKRLGFKKVISKDFANTNSANSLKLVIDNLDSDTLIMNGDLYIKNDFIRYIRKNVSQFIAQHLEKTNHPTWQYEIDENSKLIGINENSVGGLCETGIAYIAQKDLKIIKQELKKLSDKVYWEYIIQKSLKKMDFYITEVKDLIYEIDSFSDAMTHNLLTSDDIAKQCSDNNKAKRLAGLTNYNYRIKFMGKDKVIRIPGMGTEAFVDRPAERKITSVVPSSICPKTDFFDWDVKITDYLKGYHSITDEDLNTKFFNSFIKTLRILHSVKLKNNKGFKPMSMHSEIDKYEKLANRKITTETQRKYILSIADRIEKDEQVLCHRDLLYGNIMYNGKDVKLIDFEYSGFSSKYWDLANFICESNINEKQRSEIINLYKDVEDKKVRETELLVNYIWYYWAVVNNSKNMEKHYKNGLIKNFSILKVK